MTRPNSPKALGASPATTGSSASRDDRREQRSRYARGQRLLGMPTISRELLRGHERWIVPLFDQINARRRLKELYFRTGARLWAHVIDAVLGRRIRVDHWERLAALRAPRGIVAVSNHRTYFDMYIFTMLTLLRAPRVGRRFYFPVRSATWFDRPIGALANLGISFGGMWPPIFRDDRRLALNAIGLEQIAHVLGPGGIVGIHPEGQRNKGADAWEQLPARRGVGTLLRLCHPQTQVVPFFIAGVGNDLYAEWRANVLEPDRWPLRVRIGEPLSNASLCGDDASDLEIAGELMRHVGALAEEDRAVYRGRLPVDSPSTAARALRRARRAAGDGA